MNQLRPYLKHMNLGQRRALVYAKALGIARYGLALYVGQTELIKDKMTTVFMKANRAIYLQPLPLEHEMCGSVGKLVSKQLGNK